MNVVRELHTNDSICVVDQTLNIYENYKKKIQKRYDEYDYSKFNNSEHIYNKLIEYFENYESNKLGTNGVIHGDPVLSNCILDINNNFKLIDMRGQQGETLTIYGDIFYDYGKIYQSITGYDEILLNKIVSQTYKKNIIDTFRNFIIKNYGDEKMDQIKMIRNALLYTLIPLHNNEKCSQYYELINF